MNVFKLKFDLREKRIQDNKVHPLFMTVYKDDNYALVERFRRWLRGEVDYSIESKVSMAAEPDVEYGK
ncbi:MAG: hypothetical protein J5554_08225 [Paludibacteraceae bacterium]|nr:hypothetical protein [Paludibacteraceae bacterium]